MRKIICLLMSAFLSHLFVFAGEDPNDSISDKPFQKTAIGIKSGGMISNIWFPGRVDEKKLPVKPLTSGAWGVSYYRNISSNLMLSADIMYLKKGRDIDPASELYAQWLNPDYHSIPFDPISLNYLAISQSILFNTKGKITIYAGPEIYQAILVNSSSTLMNHPFYTGQGARRYDLGLGFNTGIMFPIHHSIKVNFEINGTTSAIPVFTKSEISAFGSDQYQGTIALNKTLSAAFSLCYTFRKC